MNKLYSLAIILLFSVYSFGQINGFSNLVIENTASTDIVFNVKYEYNADNPTFKDVKLYYTINKDFTDEQWATFVEEDDNGNSTNIDENRVDIKIDEKADDDMYSFSIPAADVEADDVIRFYFRGYTKNSEDDKEKDYFTPDADAEFDHDVYSQWSTLIVYNTNTDPVGFSNLVIENTASTDIVFDVKYEYNADNPEFKDVKLYYTINKDFTDEQWATFVEEDDNGNSTNIDENRVDIKIDEKADDDMYSFSIPAADVEADDVIRFYFRGYTKNSEGDKEKEYFSPDTGAEFDHDVYSQWSTLIVYSTLSNDLFKKASVSLYPVPTNNTLTFESSMSEIGTFEVFSTSGQLLINVQGNLSNKVLDVSKLGNGNYILKVTNSTNSHSYKFVK